MKQQFATVSRTMRVRLDERERRLFAAAEARSAGYGGVSAVARATGIARSTIDRELEGFGGRPRSRGLEGSPLRRRTACAHAEPIPCCWKGRRGLLESTTLGDPTRPLIWVSKSHAKLALALEGLGIGLGDPDPAIARTPRLSPPRSIARAWRAAIMSTGTLSSNTSTRRLEPFRPPASR